MYYITINKIQYIAKKPDRPVIRVTDDPEKVILFLKT